MKTKQGEREGTNKRTHASAQSSLARALRREQGARWASHCWNGAEIMCRNHVPPPPPARGPERGCRKEGSPGA